MRINVNQFLIQFLIANCIGLKLSVTNVNKINIYQKIKHNVILLVIKVIILILNVLTKLNLLNLNV